MGLVFHELPLDVFEDIQRPHIARLNKELRVLFGLEGVLSSERGLTKRSDSTVARSKEREVHITRLSPSIEQVVSGSSTIIGAPALTFSTVNAVGTTRTVVSVNSTVALFGTTAAENVSIIGSSVGSISLAARADHIHLLSSGSGSGLDADTLDTLEAIQFLRSDADDTGTGTYTLSNANPINFTNSGTTTINFGGGGSSEIVKFLGNGVNASELQVGDGTYTMSFGAAGILGGAIVAGAADFSVIAAAGDLTLTASGGNVQVTGTVIDLQAPVTITDDSLTFGLGSGGGDPTITFNGTTNDATLKWDQVVTGGSPVFVLSHGIRALTIGDGTTADPTLTFDGSPNDGTIVFDTSADEFVFADTVQITDSTAIRLANAAPIINWGSTSGNETLQFTSTSLSTATVGPTYKFTDASALSYLDLKILSTKAILQSSQGIVQFQAPTASQLIVHETVSTNQVAISVTAAGIGVTGNTGGSWVYVGNLKFTTTSGMSFACVGNAEYTTTGGALIAKTALTTQGDFTIADAKNIILSGTTGTQIGTATSQKLSVWGTTAIAQPSSTGHTTGYTAGSSGVTLQLDDVFNGGYGTKGYTVDDVVRHLKRVGILAYS